MAQRKNQRLGKSMQAEHVNHIRLKARDDFMEHRIVVQLQRFEIAELRQQRMVENAIEQQSAFHMTVALFAAHSVSGSQDENFMAAQPQIFRHRLATPIKRPGVMRRI
jgi:hypothetical protein